MAVTASVKKGFGVAKKSLAIVGLLSLFNFASNLVNLYYAPQVQQNPQVAVSVIVIIATIIFLLISIFLQAGTLGYVRETLKQGQSNFAVFMSSGKQYYGRLFLLGLIVASIAIIGVVLALLLAALLKTVGVVIAVILGVVGVYFLILMAFFSPSAIAVNDEKAVGALKKSFHMTKKNILPVLGLLGILLVIGFAAGILIGLLFGLLTAAVPGIISQVIYALASSLFNSFLGVFVTASIMNLYFEVSNR